LGIVGDGDILVASSTLLSEKPLATLQQLLDQKAQLEKQIVETQRQERSEAIAKVRALMSEHGLSASDLSTKVPNGVRPSAKKVAAKYRNQATGETWTGRGLQPKWLKAALAEGRTLNDFTI
jgi:DNA-binding protein H-NS